MRLNVRWQLAVVLVTLSLLPMAVTGVVAYRSARGALDQSIRFNLETLASQTEERLERLLLDRQVSLRGWSQLRLIQDDTVTADADGRILQFLQDAKRNFDLQELWVASAAGQVIASTLPTLLGREVGDAEWLHAARRGESWVGVPEMQEITGRVGMPIAMPLYASFDRSKTVGVIVAVIDWPKVVETLQSVKVLPEGQSERGYLLLADTRGFLLSAPTFVSGWEAGKTRLSSLGLDEVEQLAAKSLTGSATIDVRGSSYLLGFASSEPRPQLPGVWRVALLLRTDVAFAPLRSLMWTILLLSVLLAAVAAGSAVYWANTFSRPIMSLVPFLRSVAAGDLSGSFSLKRHDELGLLAQAANDMSAQLRGLITGAAAGRHPDHASLDAGARQRRGSCLRLGAAGGLDRASHGDARRAHQHGQADRAERDLGREDCRRQRACGACRLRLGRRGARGDGEHPPPRRGHLGQDAACWASARSAFPKC